MNRPFKRNAAPILCQDKTKNPVSLETGFLKERRRIEALADTPAPIKKETRSFQSGFTKERRRHTLPQIAVPSAQAGLTSLFGMGRGEPRRNNHLKVVSD